MPLHSSVDAWNKRVEEMNAMQKEDVKLQSFEAVKQMANDIKDLKRSLDALRLRIDTLEENQGI